MKIRYPSDSIFYLKSIGFSNRDVCYILDSLWFGRTSVDEVQGWIDKQEKLAEKTRSSKGNPKEPADESRWGNLVI